MKYGIVNTSTKFIISSKFIHQILSLVNFHKKLLNICLANCSQIVSSFAMPSRFAGAPALLNQMRFAQNFVFEKIFSLSKKHARDSPKSFYFGFLHKRRFSPQFFGEYFSKNIHNLRIKNVL